MTAVALMEKLFSTAWSVITAVLPLVVLFMIFQIFVLGLPRRDVRNILVGTLLAGAGLFLFLVGVTIGLMPFGRAVGDAIGSVAQKWLLLPAGLVLGFVTAWGEPAVRILADQVDYASNGSIRRSLVLYAICFGVSVSGGLGLLRIGFEIPLLYFLVPGYLLVDHLGSGGMGVVYRAVRLADDEVVAVKMIQPSLGGSQEDYQPVEEAPHAEA